MICTSVKNMPFIVMNSFTTFVNWILERRDGLSTNVVFSGMVHFHPMEVYFDFGDSKIKTNFIKSRLSIPQILATFFGLVTPLVDWILCRRFLVTTRRSKGSHISPNNYLTGRKASEPHNFAQFIRQLTPRSCNLKPSEDF